MGDSQGHVTRAAGKNKENPKIVFALTLFYLIAEVVGGLWTGTLALLADAKITLVEFYNPECESCAAFAPVVKRQKKAGEL